jgi:hypothetical protein
MVEVLKTVAGLFLEEIKKFNAGLTKPGLRIKIFSIA